MNHLFFIIAAYSLTLAATIVLGAASFMAMRRAEREADAMRREP